MVLPKQLAVLLKQLERLLVVSSVTTSVVGTVSVVDRELPLAEVILSLVSIASFVADMRSTTVGTPSFFIDVFDFSNGLLVVGRA